MITTALFRVRPNLCSRFNPVYRGVWGWSEKLSITFRKLSDIAQKKENKNPGITVISAFIEKEQTGSLGGLWCVPWIWKLIQLWKKGNRNLPKKSDMLEYICTFLGGRKGQIAGLFSSEDTMQHQDASERSCVQINRSTGKWEWIQMWFEVALRILVSVFSFELCIKIK